MNKQNLWFLTLFSLILVLGIYYVTMPNELLLGKNESTVKTTTQKSTKRKFYLRSHASQSRRRT